MEIRNQELNKELGISLNMEITFGCNLATRSSMYVYLRVYILALAQGIIYAQTPLFLLAITSNDMKMHRPISELKYLTYVRSSILI